MVDRGKFVITGGSAGIGLAIAHRLIADGAEVALVGRDQARMDTVVGELGPAASGYCGNLDDVADIARIFGAIGDRFAAIDGLVASAGTALGGLLESATEATFDQVFNTNVKSVFFTAQHALALLANPANIVIIGSVADNMVVPGGSIYAASKAALGGFVRCWAEELAPRGIRVHLVGPGYTQTPMLERATADPAGKARVDEWLASRSSLKRIGQPEEVAALVAFLCSDQSSLMTGSTIYAAGGAQNF